MFYTIMYQFTKHLSENAKTTLIFVLSATEGQIGLYFAKTIGILGESLHAGFISFVAAICGGLGGVVLKLTYEYLYNKNLKRLARKRLNEKKK